MRVLIVFFPLYQFHFLLPTKFFLKVLNFFLCLGVEFLHDSIRTYVFQLILTRFSATLI